ncbi:SRPBCC domain-containing protein [Kitasatospora sp. NPDC002227]|uniref:SRPBCC domain-containing protein n=1 Tax=Kitasatospora sp. NPDC002227 TaxID=3154773 RepID=UPI00332B78BC
MTKAISAEIEIEAPTAEVWEALADLASYPSWNPFIREAHGRVAVGETLTLKMHPTGGRPMTFRPKVLAADPGVELRWLGRLVLPGLFDGEHGFRLHPTGTGGTHLVQSENFSGALVPVTGRVIDRTRGDFTALNEALKKHVENR